MHVKWNELSMDGLDLRGLVYRTKMARSGMPFAVAGDGVLGVVDCQGRAWPAVFLMLMSPVWRPEIAWGLTSCQMSCFSLGTYLLQNFDHGPMRKRSKSYVTCWRSTCHNVQMLLCPIHFIRVKRHICHTCHNAIWGVRIVAYRATTDLVQWNYMPETTLSGLCGLSVRCCEESGAAGCLPRPLLVGVVRQCRPSLCL